MTAQRYTFYTDGEYEYRVERHGDDSAAQHTGQLGLRVWSATQRAIAPPTVVTYSNGRSRKMPEPWETLGRVYAPNDAADVDIQARRLLGSKVVDGSTADAWDAAAAKRRGGTEK